MEVNLTHKDCGGVSALPYQQYLGGLDLFWFVQEPCLVISLLCTYLAPSNRWLCYRCSHGDPVDGAFFPVVPDVTLVVHQQN